MSQQQAAQLLSRVLSNVAKYSVFAGVGVTALQSSLYTGDLIHEIRATPNISVALVHVFYVPDLVKQWYCSCGKLLLLGDLDAYEI